MKLHSTRPWLLVAALAMLTPPVRAGGPGVADVLDAVRCAVGTASGSSSIEIRGTIDRYGMENNFSIHQSDDGRYRWSIDGPLPVVGGFDGRTAWVRDHSDTPRVLALGDRDTELVSSWLLSGYWMHESAPFTFSVESDAADDDMVTLAFAFDDGDVTGVVRLDRTTGLPLSASWNDGAARVEFAEHGRFGEVMVPHLITMSTELGGVEHLDVLRVRRLGHDIEALTVPQLDPPSGTRFHPERGHELRTHRTWTQRLLVRPRINGRDVGWFIFDSGASTAALSNTVAARLGLEPIGEVHVQGAGGSTPSAFYLADQLDLGPLEMRRPSFVGLDLDFLTASMGVEIAGIVGYELLTRCVVRYDSVAGRIALYDPQRFELQDAPWQELLTYQRNACVRATYEGRSAWFKLDTGAAGTVVMHAPAVERHGLLDRRPTRTGAMGGVGGSVAAREGPLRTFELAGRRFENLQIRFATEHTGAFADRYTDGNIGMDLLRPFELIFDYPNRRIAFVEKGSP